MSIDYNGSKELEITRVPTVRKPAPTPYEGLRPARIEVGREEIEKLWELTPLEKAGLAVDSGLRTIKITTGLMPYVFNTIAGLIMKNWKTTVSAVIGGVAYLVNAMFGLHLPTEAITIVTLFFVGVFAGDAGNTSTTNNHE